MKILFSIGVPNDTGIATYAKIIQKKLIEKGIEVSNDSKHLEKYDIIHIHSIPDARLFASKIINNPKIIVSAHVTSKEVEDFFPKQLKQIVEKFLERGYGFADKIFVYNKELYNEFKKNNLTNKKAVFLPISFELKKFKQKSNKTFLKKKLKLKNKKIVLCVGSIQKRKGIFDFIEIAKKLPQYNFVWVGRIPKMIYLNEINQIKKIIQNKPTNVFFTGELYNQDLINAYSSANLFWFPTKSETFGLVNIEAAANGINILIPNLKVFNQFKKFAIIYKNNPERKIIEILENPNKFKEKIKIGKNEVKKYDIDQNIDKIIYEYNKVLNKKSNKNNKIKFLELNLKKYNIKKNIEKLSQKYQEIINQKNNTKQIIKIINEKYSLEKTIKKLIKEYEEIIKKIK